MAQAALENDIRHEVDYEEWYHATRHNNHFNDDYYNARAKIAVKKFFSGIENDANCSTSAAAWVRISLYAQRHGL